MCGILGLSGHFNPLLIQEGLASIAHRGPDDFGVYISPESNVALGHNRLSILDLSPQGHQPMTSADGLVVLVFNGEIYNFRGLRFELEQKGYIFNGHSDTEVLLKLYLQHRTSSNGVPNMLQRLNGIFAFAIWDADRGELLVARDALGVKPIYYNADGKSFAFASEIKALLPSSVGARGLDIAAIDRYLSFLWCPGEGTPSSQVHKLPPGEALWVKEGRIAERFRWYQLPAFQLGGKNSNLGLADAVRGTEHYLRQAVQRQLVADVPVGAFLSGGLDSSSVVAFAREQNPDIRCFTIECTGSSEEGIPDDLPYARRVAAHLNVPLEIVRIDAARMAEDLPAMVVQLDEPLADPAPLNVLYII